MAVILFTFTIANFFYLFLDILCLRICKLFFSFGPFSVSFLLLQSKSLDQGVYYVFTFFCQDSLLYRTVFTSARAILLNHNRFALHLRIGEFCLLCLAFTNGRKSLEKKFLSISCPSSIIFYSLTYCLPSYTPKISFQSYQKRPFFSFICL